MSSEDEVQAETVEIAVVVAFVVGNAVVVVAVRGGAKSKLVRIPVVTGPRFGRSI